MCAELGYGHMQLDMPGVFYGTPVPQKGRPFEVARLG
jgi:hypothetical protein